MTMVVTTGRACAPIAAMVETSAAMPAAPLGSLALKLITQAGGTDSCKVSSPGASVRELEGVSVVMAQAPRKRGDQGFGNRPQRIAQDFTKTVSNVVYVSGNP